MSTSAVARPPGPGSALHGRRRAFVDDPTGFLSELHRTYGDVVYFRVGLRDNYLLCDPGDVKDVLVTRSGRFHKGPALQDGRLLAGDNLFNIEDEVHRRHRKLIQPAFHRQRLGGFAPVMVEETVALAERFRDGESRDVAADMAQLTLGVAVRTLFGSAMTPERREEVTGYVRVLLGGMFDRTSARRTSLLREEYRRALEGSGALVEGMIRDRHEHPGERGDLLSMLVEARDEDGPGLSDREIRDEIAALIVAGHETTSNALAWTWYLLSQNPDAEARMHAEIDEVLGDRLPTFEDLRSLSYVDRVFTESLRAIPPIWAIDRSVVEDHTAGGYPIPSDSVVFTSPWVVHHDPRWFEDPERFDPDRWTPDRRRSRTGFSYFPFGGGPRVCVGEAFATTEAALILAVLGRWWRFRLEPDQTLETEAGITIRPRHGIRMRLERREGSR
jgi:cytochrome P450